MKSKEKSLYLLGHNVTNRELDFFFYRSRETISRHFHNVVRAIIELEDKFFKQPDRSQVPSEIFNNNRFCLTRMIYTIPLMALTLW